MSQTKPHVAIIGGGLAGLALGLTLNQQKMPCEIYETRPAPLDIGGAVMLSPNALKVLDALKIYDELQKQGYSFRNLTWQTLDDSFVEREEFGSKEEYGYDALRVHRFILINSLQQALKSAGVPVHFGKKYVGAVEDDSGVTFSFADGTSAHANLLIGADGIHSSVRRHMYPDLTPRFLNMAGVTAAVPIAAANLSPEAFKDLEAPSLPHPLPLTIQHPKHGAFVLAPQRAGPKEIFIGRQRQWDDTDRAGWDARLADKKALAEFLASDTEDFPQLVKDIVKDIPHDTINVWPFYVIPKLTSWASCDGNGRILLVGDAAHAIPPSAGQGVNQAFEDVYTLGLALSKFSDHGAVASELPGVVRRWQDFRLARVERILELNSMIEARRTPKPDRTPAQQGLAEKKMERGWLYGVDFKAEVDSWFQS